VRLSGRQSYLGDLIYAYGMSNQRERARASLRELTGLAHRQYVSPHEFAIAYLGLDDYDSAFAWLERATDARLSAVSVLQVDPIFDHLQSDPRLAYLLARANLK
jgi:hypothetical protein